MALSRAITLVKCEHSLTFTCNGFVRISYVFVLGQLKWVFKTLKPQKSKF